MMLWLVLALMTAAAIFAVLWPLARRAPLRAGSDIAVYRDQLEEIERDRAAGLIGEREAEAARIEVSRRLLAAADAAPASRPDGTARGAGGRPRSRRLSCCRWARPVFILALGSPGLPDQAAVGAARDVAAEQRPIAELVGKVEAHLEQNPDDGRGWEVLAPVYMRLGRYDDAVKARKNALRLLGATAEREADLGEALTGAQNGVVTAEAKEAFDRAVGARSATMSRRAISSALPPSRTAGRRSRRRRGGRCWRKRPPDAALGRFCPAIAGACRSGRGGASRGRAPTRSRRRTRCRPSSATRWCAAWSHGLPNG